MRHGPALKVNCSTVPLILITQGQNRGHSSQLKSDAKHPHIRSL